MKIDFQTNRIIQNTQKIPQKRKIPFKAGLGLDIFYQVDTTLSKGRDSYEPIEIMIAKSYLNCADDSWKTTEFNKRYEDCKYYNGFQEYTLAQIDATISAQVNLNNKKDRIIAGLSTFGFSEINYFNDNRRSKRETEDYIKRLALIRTDLINAQTNENIASAKKEVQASQRKLNYLEQINTVKTQELYPKLIDKIQARKEGKNVEIPNCIMVSNPDTNVCEELIDFCLKQTNCHSETCNPYDSDLVEVLENAQKRYEETGNWNLIYVKDMDNLINPSIVKQRTISGMKAIMSAASEQYHSTLIFSTANPMDLDDTAIESNRVTKINSQNIKTVRQMQKEDSIKNLENNDYIQNSPINALNDLIILADDNKCCDSLNFYSERTELDKIKDFLGEKLQTPELAKYLKTLNTICKNIWYIPDVN